MRIKNNKGAALITVLIAMMFIAILASSLIYMSYMNYETKSMRWAASNSFYYDEFALDDLTAEMQQLCADSADIDAAITALETSCGVSGGTYDPAVLQSNFLHIANKNPANITVTLSTPTGMTAAYSREGNVATFKNLMITTTDPVREYTSSIIVDVTVGVNNAGKADMDVNDFSIITDSPVDWTNGGNMIYGGNIFIMSDEWNVSGGKAAVKVNGMSNVSITGERGIIVGDVEINGGQLSIGGDVVITGNIKISNGGVLMCTSNLKVGGTINTTGGGAVYGDYDDTITLKVDDYFGASGSYKNGLAHLLLEDFYVVDAQGNLQKISGVDIIDTGTTDPVTGAPITTTMAKAGGTLSGISGFLGSPDDIIDHPAADSGVTCMFRGGSNDITIMPRTLMFLPTWQQNRYDFTGSTVICPVAGTTATSLDSTAGVTMTHMSDDDYDLAKSTLMTKISNNSTTHFYMVSGNKSQLETIVENHKSGTAFADASAGADGSAEMADGTIIYSWTSGSEVRYAVATKTGGGSYPYQSYLPWGYLISGNSKSILSDLFTGLVGDTSSENAEVHIVRWLKE